MSKQPLCTYEPDTVLFASGEEAWFWFSMCQKIRFECTPSRDDSSPTPRPCLPDDIYRVIMALHRKRRIETYHLQVLGSYGEKLTPPDPYCSEEATDARLWEEALAYLEEELILKGLME